MESSSDGYEISGGICRDVIDMGFMLSDMADTEEQYVIPGEVVPMISQDFLLGMKQAVDASLGYIAREKAARVISTIPRELDELGINVDDVESAITCHVGTPPDDTR